VFVNVKNLLQKAMKAADPYRYHVCILSFNVFKHL